MAWNCPAGHANPDDTANFCGNCGLAKNPPPAPPAPTRPAAPANFSAAHNAGAVECRWSESADADDYQVFRQTGNRQFEEICDDDILVYVDTDVEPGKTYRYYVRATNAHGTGHNSNMVTVQIPAPTPSREPRPAHGHGDEGHGKGFFGRVGDDLKAIDKGLGFRQD